MKSDLRTGAVYLLVAMGSLILFLLVFEESVQVPTWLQLVGRMHPLLLHFPIVLILVAMAMDLFRGAKSISTDAAYEKLTSVLLLCGVVTAGAVVLMGIFLSKEGGYDAATLFWHKWTGVLAFYLGWTVHAWRRQSWYSPTVAKLSATLVCAVVIAAGHFGAALTHGSFFITQPVVAQATPVTTLDSALAFDHIVRPILQEKCVSCHNLEKHKGDLILLDSLSLLKGGKNGSLFVRSDPHRSLIIERLNLPADHKKHMPPAKKPQLTDSERLLLYHWIKSGAPFSKRVTEIHEADSFRLLATHEFEKTRPDELYDFPAVALETIEQLNSDYRSVRPLAVNSPALAVNLYNRQSYTPKTLDDLKEVERQVTSLNLSKMPIDDDQVKYILRFDNLRHLNLNYTAISGQGLQALTRLHNLRSLALVGTPLTYDEVLSSLPHFKKLNSLTLWNTSVTESQTRDLQKRFRHIRLQGADSYEGIGLIKLNPPLLKNKTIVFEDSLFVELFHPVRDVEIRFSTDGLDPDSIGGEKFTGSMVLTETTAIKARAFKEGWLSSDVTTLNVFSRRHTPDTAILMSRLNRVHTAKGAETFFDRELGSFNANSPAWANNWAGVINNDLELILKYDRPRVVTSVSLNVLIETENHLFPPAMIEIWGGSSEESLRQIGKISPEMPENYSKPYIERFDCKLTPTEVSCLRLLARPVMKLPAWHRRKDRPALLLVDEILVN